jgi:hypothetical protein
MLWSGLQVVVEDVLVLEAIGHARKTSFPVPFPVYVIPCCFPPFMPSFLLRLWLHDFCGSLSSAKAFGRATLSNDMHDTRCRASRLAAIRGATASIDCAGLRHSTTINPLYKWLPHSKPFSLHDVLSAL